MEVDESPLELVITIVKLEALISTIEEDILGAGPLKIQRMVSGSPIVLEIFWALYHEKVDGWLFHVFLVVLIIWLSIPVKVNDEG